MKIGPQIERKDTFVSIITIIFLFGGSILFLTRSNTEASFKKNSEDPSTISLQNNDNKANNNINESINKNDRISPALACLRKSIDTIEKLPSVSAEIQLRLFLFDTLYNGIGKYEELSFRNERVARSSGGNTYIEKRSPLEWNSFRLHVKLLSTEAKALEPNSNENFLEVVCDRQALWTYTSIEGNSTLTQINIEDLANSLSKLSNQEKQKLFENGVEHPCGMSGLPELGGLSGLLKRISTFYRFEPEIIKEQFRGGNYPVWHLVGEIKKEKLEIIRNRLLNINNSLSASYLDFIPTHIDLYIGCNTNFPCQIKYSSITDEKKKIKKSLMEMDFTRIILADSTLRPENFIYGTPRKNYDRINQEYLKTLIPDIEF